MYPTKKLSEICDIQNWFAFDANQFSDSDWFPIIRIRDLKNSTIQTFYIWEVKDDFIVRKWDYLIWMDWEFRCYEWNNSDALLNQRVCRFVNYDKSLVPRFLLYWINKYLRDIEDNTPFVTVKHISSKQIKDINFPLPPFSTQTAIVARLDAAFANIDEQIALFRASIEDAKKIKESALGESFSGDFPTKKLSEILSKEKYSAWKVKAQDYLEDGSFPIIDQGKSLIGGYSNNSKSVYTGKLPVLVYGDHTNVVKYIDFPFIEGADGTKILAFNNTVNVKYAYYLVSFFKPETQGYRRHFTLLKEKIFPIALLPRQQEIVAYLDSVFATSDMIIREYEAQIRDLEILKQSLLREAFEGRLVSE